MTRVYRHRQFSMPVVVSGVLLGAVFAAILIYLASRPMRDVPLLVAIGSTALVLTVAVGLHYALSSMTIEIDGGELRWHFGPGVWRKRVALTAIARVRHVRLPWWYGIGVKYIPGGSVYLVAPGEAVEIVTIEGRLVRLGTDDPEGLTAALDRYKSPS